MPLSMPFITTNLDLAAYLLAVGQELTEVERQGKFFAFHFDPLAASHVEQFINGAPAPAKTLLDSYRQLRTIITNHQKGAKELCQQHFNL
jgi:hypothetical protein